MRVETIVNFDSDANVFKVRFQTYVGSTSKVRKDLIARNLVAYAKHIGKERVSMRALFNRSLVAIVVCRLPSAVCQAHKSRDDRTFFDPAFLSVQSQCKCTHHARDAYMQLDRQSPPPCETPFDTP